MAVLGHVDSGKTSLLDRIRGTGVQGREAGGITQHIGASFLPLETIREACGPIYKGIEKSDVRVPGLLVIDTPGHEVFRNLRTRGGSAADIAILVVDAARGFQPQTRESLAILQERRVPFVVALNKCDQISGWRPSGSEFITDALKAQDQSVRADLDQKIYDVVGTLSILGYQSEAFYRVKDFKSEVAIVPVSARHGTGLPELLGVLVGLAQQYLAGRLGQQDRDPRGIVLEVRDEEGLGQTANVILVDGSIQKGDSVVVARRDSVVVAKPRALLLPRPLDEMRDPRDRFQRVDRVDAAAGIKIASPEMEGVLPGSTMYVARDRADAARYSGMIESEMKSVFSGTEPTGVVVRCDTIGSLEAVSEMLSREQVAVSDADIGPVTRRDVVAAGAIRDKDRHLGVVLAFNVRVLPDARSEAAGSRVRIFEDGVIYSLVEGYCGWVREDAADAEGAAFADVTPVASFTILPGHVFRNSGPAVFGIRVDAGVLRHKAPLMDGLGRRVGEVHQLQRDGKTVETASSGEEVACSVTGAVVGRQLREGATYMTFPTSREARDLLGRFLHRLDAAQQDALGEMVRIQRGRDPAYAY
ncbi:MAG: translation initiation factor IF-2 [Nitrosopumilus sp.]|nr:translation initiation factor IF-2 [Nitrosopumilus sp.]